MFESGTGEISYDFYWSDIVGGAGTPQPQLTSQQACGCGCAADAKCDAWKFCPPGHFQFEDFPGCTFFDIRDTPTRTPCSFDKAENPTKQFWVRAGKHTNIQSCK